MKRYVMLFTLLLFWLTQAAARADEYRLRPVWGSRLIQAQAQKGGKYAFSAITTNTEKQFAVLPTQISQIIQKK